MPWLAAVAAKAQPVASRGAVHDAVVPPFDPVQLQAKELVPLTAEAVPVLQRPALGAELTATLAEEPQAPLITGGGLQVGLPLAATVETGLRQAPEKRVWAIMIGVRGASTSDVIPQKFFFFVMPTTIGDSS